ncbi:MAG: hypothetical protein ACREQ5_03945 [Candidatus Dormibacteria bacterium]
MNTGLQLRLAGINDCLAAGTAMNRTYREHAENVLRELASSGRRFSADDIHAAIMRVAPGVEPHHKNLLPSIMGHWVKWHWIYRVDFVNSKRSTRHASRNSVYVGARKFGELYPQQRSEAA